jgi:hypothetical protein
VKESGGYSFFELDGSLKWLAVCMVSAEIIICKLLSTQASGIKHLDFT